MGDCEWRPNELGKAWNLFSIRRLNWKPQFSSLNANFIDGHGGEERDKDFTR